MRSSNSKPKASQHPATGPQPDQSNNHPMLERALRQIAAEHYDKALDMLNSMGQDAQVQNLRGVCLLRVGNYAEAIRVLRNLLISPGTTWMRHDLPLVFKLNFATALLLGGHPGGCLDMLAEIAETDHPSVVRLKANVKRWEKTLSIWQRIDWWFGRVEPANRPVTLDFVPGEIEPELLRTDKAKVDVAAAENSVAMQPAASRLAL